LAEKDITEKIEIPEKFRPFVNDYKISYFADYVSCSDMNNTAFVTIGITKLLPRIRLTGNRDPK
jgi:hypothetical protein